MDLKSLLIELYPLYLLIGSIVAIVSPAFVFSDTRVMFRIGVAMLFGGFALFLVGIVTSRYSGSARS